MPRLPVVSGREAVKAFQKVEYEYSHQTGSHIILRSKEPPHRHLTIPDHKELGRGLLRGLIRDAGLTIEQFIELL